MPQKQLRRADTPKIWHLCSLSVVRDAKENKYVHIVTLSPISTCKVELHEIKHNVFVVRLLDQELGDLSFHQSYKKFLVDKPNYVL